MSFCCRAWSQVCYFKKPFLMCWNFCVEALVPNGCLFQCLSCSLIFRSCLLCKFTFYTGLLCILQYPLYYVMVWLHCAIIPHAVCIILMLVCMYVSLSYAPHNSVMRKMRMGSL